MTTLLSVYNRPRSSASRPVSAESKHNNELLNVRTHRPRAARPRPTSSRTRDTDFHDFNVDDTEIDRLTDIFGEDLAADDRESQNSEKSSNHRRRSTSAPPLTLNTLNKAVFNTMPNIDKEKYMNKIREYYYDVQLASPYQSEYDPLYDEALQHYFQTHHIRRHLLQLGLIDEQGHILDKKKFKKKIIQMEHARKEQLQQAAIKNNELESQIKQMVRSEIYQRRDQKSPPKLKLSDDIQQDIQKRYPPSLQKTATLYNEYAKSASKAPLEKPRISHVSERLYQPSSVLRQKKIEREEEERQLLAHENLHNRKMLPKGGVSARLYTPKPVERTAQSPVEMAQAYRERGWNRPQSSQPHKRLTAEYRQQVMMEQNFRSPRTPKGYYPEEFDEDDFASPGPSDSYNQEEDDEDVQEDGTSQMDEKQDENQERDFQKEEQDDSEDDKQSEQGDGHDSSISDVDDDEEDQQHSGHGRSFSSLAKQQSKQSLRDNHNSMHFQQDPATSQSTYSIINYAVPSDAALEPLTQRYDSSPNNEKGSHFSNGESPSSIYFSKELNGREDVDSTIEDIASYQASLIECNEDNNNFIDDDDNDGKSVGIDGSGSLTDL